MSWVVSFSIVSGTYRERPSDGTNMVWVGETVRFVLSLSGDPDPTQVRAAQSPENWNPIPQLVVTGHQRDGRPIRKR